MIEFCPARADDDILRTDPLMTSSQVRTESTDNVAYLYRHVEVRLRESLGAEYKRER